ncbi:ATP-dependent DNA helicase RecQ, partial [Streptomyces sp. NRRL B-24085]
MSERKSPGAAERLARAADEVFGWSELRPGQLAAMEAVMRGRDTLAVMPTGAGKSAVYQVPGLLLPGPTVVVSPLIALQRDQIAGLLGHAGAPEAVAVNSAQAAGETEAAWDAVRHGDAEFLFLSPEQLAKDEVVERLAQAAPSLFVVDEAQCVAAWGHDFRPDYLRLAQAAQRVGRPPVLALTATAAPPVREEIVERLGMADPELVVAGFDRPNIALEVRRFQDDADKRRVVVERAAAEPKPGIVYAATRRDAEEYAADLAALGLSATAYHAGLTAGERSRAHDAFLAGDTDVVVATSAFGMGIDK